MCGNTSWGQYLNDNLTNLKLRSSSSAQQRQIISSRHISQLDRLSEAQIETFPLSIHVFWMVLNNTDRRYTFAQLLTSRDPSKMNLVNQCGMHGNCRRVSTLQARWSTNLRVDFPSHSNSGFALQDCPHPLKTGDSALRLSKT